MESTSQDKKEKYPIIVLLALFTMLIFAKRINVYLFDLIEIAIVGMFVFVKPAKMLVPMYIFYVFWYEALTFHLIGVSVGLILDTLVAFRLWFSIGGSCKVNKPDRIMLLLLVIYAPVCFMTNGVLSGFALVAEMMIILYLKMTVKTENSELSINWSDIFFVITCSAMLNVLYGIFNNTGIMRLFAGTRILQISGTTFPARTGVYCVCGLIYPFFFCKKKVFRILISVFLIAMNLMTVSMTGIGALLMFLVLSFILKDAKEKNEILKKIGVTFASFIIVLLVIRIVKSSTYLSTIQLRFNRVYNELLAGKYGEATTGRTDLHSVYYEFFNELPLFNKIFGTGLITARWKIGALNFSHLTYLDILICYGIVGIFIYFLAFINGIVARRKDKEFIPIMILKILMLILGAGGSLLTNTSWFVLFLA